MARRHTDAPGGTSAVAHAALGVRANTSRCYVAAAPAGVLRYMAVYGNPRSPGSDPPTARAVDSGGESAGGPSLPFLTLTLTLIYGYWLSIASALPGLPPGRRGRVCVRPARFYPLSAARFVYELWIVRQSACEQICGKIGGQESPRFFGLPAHLCYNVLCSEVA